MPRPLSPEDDLFDWLRRRMPGGERIGDDAVLVDLGGPATLSVDQQIEGVHFPSGLDARWLARRLLEVCLSDLAATAARPRYAMLAIAAPDGWPLRSFLSALATALRGHRMELVGGDTATAESVRAALWVVGDRPAGGRFVGRRGAQPGDRLWIGGHLGWSALGRQVVARGGRPCGRRLHLPQDLETPPRLARAARRALRAHLAPRAQIELGRWLGRRRRAAAIDVSDGLALDLHRLCRASHVGARLDPEPLLGDPDLLRLGEVLETPVEDAVLGGGEDYQLLFALPPALRPPADLSALPLGRVVAESGVSFGDSGRSLSPTGWSHL